MRLGKYLSSLTKPELEELKDKLNLSDDELEAFEHLSKNRYSSIALVMVAQNIRQEK